MSKKITIVLYGDSLLARCGVLFLDIIEEKIPNSILYNCAAGGQDSSDGVRRVGLISKLNPDYVIISFGANDVASWRNNISENDFESNLSKIIAAFSKSRVVTFQCPPVNYPGKSKESTAFNRKLAKYNEIVRSVSQRCNALTIESNKMYGPLLKSGRNYHEEDGLHLNADGYMIFINEVTHLINLSLKE